MGNSSNFLHLFSDIISLSITFLSSWLLTFITVAFVFLLSLDGVVSAGCASQIFRNAFARNQETNSKQFLRVVQLCISEKRSGALSAIVKVRSSTGYSCFLYRQQGNE